MLQHNSPTRPETSKSGASKSGAAKNEAHRAHWAHAAVLSLHAICCGAPIALLLVGAVTASVVGAGWVLGAHAFLHAHEFWLLALSGSLVVYGGFGEWRARKSGAHAGFPVLWAMSGLCLAANVTIVVLHRL